MSSGTKFSATTREEWEELAQKITKGVMTDEALATLTYDDIALRPLYDRSDLESLEGLDNYGDTFSTKDWEVRQFVDLGMVMGDAANGEEGGSGEPKDILSNTLEEIKSEGAGGVCLHAPNTLDPEILKAIIQASTARGAEQVPSMNLSFSAGARCFEVADAFLEVLGQDNMQPDIKNSQQKISLNVDPLGVLARIGELDRDPTATLKELPKYFSGSNSDMAGSSHSLPAGIQIIPIGVDVSVYDEAGATLAEQISFGLATGVDYLRTLTKAGVAPQKAVASMEFTLSASPEMFQTIAFFRAFQLCWQRIGQASGFEVAPIRIHGVTPPSYLTRQDPWVNILRSTSACFGAVLGGASAVTVLPFDYGWGRSDSVSRRLAANTSHILKRESHIARIKDPVRGSYYLESFTSELAEAGWEHFQEIESHGSGSMLELLTSGKVRDITQRSWERQSADIGDDKKIVIGVNKFRLDPRSLDGEGGTGFEGKNDFMDREPISAFTPLSERDYPNLFSIEALDTECRPRLYEELTNDNESA